MNKKLVVVVSALVGVVLIVVAIVYLTTPARALPVFFPGYDPSLTKIHRTHGLGALILGLGCFVLAWFQSGAKSGKQENEAGKGSDQ